jgi:hypothetical protein
MSSEFYLPSQMSLEFRLLPLYITLPRAMAVTRSATTIHRTIPFARFAGDESKMRYSICSSFMFH